MPAVPPPPPVFLVGWKNRSTGERGRIGTKFGNSVSKKHGTRGQLVHQKELVDAFDENKKNEGSEIRTGRGGSGGDDVDSRAFAPSGGRPAMDVDETSGAEASNDDQNHQIFDF